jgi:hypothetical protein
MRFSIRIPIRFSVRFAAKDVKQVNFDFFLAEMCKQTIDMGNGKRIGSLLCLHTNLARNRTAIRMQIRTRVEGPLPYHLGVCKNAHHAQREIDRQREKEREMYVFYV